MEASSGELCRYGSDQIVQVSGFADDQLENVGTKQRSDGSWKECSRFVPLSGNAIYMNVIKGFVVVHSQGGNAWLLRPGTSSVHSLPEYQSLIGTSHVDTEA